MGCSQAAAGRLKLVFHVLSQQLHTRRGRNEFDLVNTQTVISGEQSTYERLVGSLQAGGKVAQAPAGHDEDGR